MTSKFASSGPDWPARKPPGNAPAAACRLNCTRCGPVRSTPAHQTPNFAELVCSNSLKSDSENTAPWLLKQEMRRAGSLLMEIAQQTAVPAGHALAVDREKFAEAVTEAIEAEPLIHVVREEVTRIDESDGITIVATGPLTSDALSQRDPAAQRQRAALLLRLDQPHRRSRLHRHVARLHGRALRQGHRRLHQLPDDSGRSTTASSMRWLRRSRSTPRTGRT